MSSKERTSWSSIVKVLSFYTFGCSYCRKAKRKAPARTRKFFFESWSHEIALGQSPQLNANTDGCGHGDQWVVVDQLDENEAGCWQMKDLPQLGQNMVGGLFARWQDGGASAESVQTGNGAGSSPGRLDSSSGTLAATRTQPQMAQVDDGLVMPGRGLVYTSYKMKYAAQNPEPTHYTTTNPTKEVVEKDAQPPESSNSAIEENIENGGATDMTTTTTTKTTATVTATTAITDTAAVTATKATTAVTQTTKTKPPPLQLQKSNDTGNTSSSSLATSSSPISSSSIAVSGFQAKATTITITALATSPKSPTLTFSFPKPSIFRKKKRRKVSAEMVKLRKKWDNSSPIMSSAILRAQRKEDRDWMFMKPPTARDMKWANSLGETWFMGGVGGVPDKIEGVGVDGGKPEKQRWGSRKSSQGELMFKMERKESIPGSGLASGLGSGVGSEVELRSAGGAGGFKDRERKASIATMATGGITEVLLDEKLGEYVLPLSEDKPKRRKWKEKGKWKGKAKAMAKEIERERKRVMEEDDGFESIGSEDDGYISKAESSDDDDEEEEEEYRGGAVYVEFDNQPQPTHRIKRRSSQKSKLRDMVLRGRQMNTSNRHWESFRRHSLGAMPRRRDREFGGLGRSRKENRREVVGGDLMPASSKAQAAAVETVEMVARAPIKFAVQAQQDTSDTDADTEDDDDDDDDDDGTSTIRPTHRQRGVAARAGVAVA